MPNLVLRQLVDELALRVPPDGPTVPQERLFRRLLLCKEPDEQAETRIRELLAQTPHRTRPEG